jgi:hypothetical protein
MVASAQVKLVLENSWDIRTFETQDALSPLRIIVKRSHHQPEVSRLRYLPTASQRSPKAEVS